MRLCKFQHTIRNFKNKSLRKEIKVYKACLYNKTNVGVGRFLDWARINVVGASGGIVIFWDSRGLQLIGKEGGHFSVACRFKIHEDNFQLAFTGIYGPTDGGSRVLLWEELGAIRGIWDDP